MSIEINSIKNNPSPYPSPSRGEGKNATFKSNPIPQDKVEISSKKKGLSDGTKIGIGIGALTLIGVGIYKRKSLKTLWEKIFGKGNKKPPEKPNKPSEPNEVPNKPKQGEVNEKEKPKGVKGEEKPQTTGTSSLPHIADFKNIDEAKEYFESIGIKTIFKPGTEKHLEDLNSFKKDFLLMEQNGVAMPKPDGIIFGDWSNQNEMREIFNSLHLRDRAAQLDRVGLWGTVERAEDGKLYAIINTKFSNYCGIAHEMGHIHQDSLHSSYWQTKLSSEKEFLDKQLEVFGLTDIGLHDLFLRNMADGFGRDNIKSIFRGYNFADKASTETKEKLYQMFPGIGENDLEKIFTIVGKNGKTYRINAKKMVDKMASEFDYFYAPTRSFENVAEIFSRLNRGQKFSDLVMLMYDINGGGRVPNLIIKGKKYDDYIESLYNNHDLIRQLRESIEVKELV